MPHPERVPTPYGAEPAERDSPSLLATLRRRFLIVVLTTLLVGAAAVGIAYVQRDSYETTAKLLFRQTIGPELIATGQQPTAPDVDKLTQDNVAVVDSRAVADLTARRLGGRSAQDVERDVTIAGTKNDDVVSIVARAHSARAAARLARVYTRAAKSFAERAQADRARSTAATLRTQLAALTTGQRNAGPGRDLRNRLSQVELLADVGTGSPQIIQDGFVPTTKTGNPLRTIILGVLFGVVLGVGLALLRDQADRRLHRPDEVSAAFDAPVLTTVPRHRSLKRHVPMPDLPPEVAEAFRMLQANLRYGHTDPVRSVVVTSARNQEGKTTTSWYLAAAAASAGLSVALVEADLRRPTIADRYGLRPEFGLTEVLRGQLSVAEALQPVSPYADVARYDGHRPGLDVLVAGTPPHDPWALMQSPAIGELIEVLEERHQLVVLDTPPIQHVADAISLLPHVDGVIVTASVNSTRGPEARRLRDQLHELEAKIIGVVANGGSAATGYGYAPTPRGDDDERFPAGTRG